MELADYRDMFAVLDSVADAVAHEHFFELLRESLASRLGWADSMIVDIPAELGDFPRREIAMDHFHTNRSPRYLEEYLDRWYMRNPFKSASANLLLDRRSHVSLRDLRTGSTTDEWAFVEGYLHKHRIADVLNSRIVGSGGAALLCVYFNDESDLLERDHLLMAHLSRQLGPWLDRHFSCLPTAGVSPTLSGREKQIAQLVASGLSNAQIAQRLHITIDTVKKHLTHAMSKTGCANRTQLALLFIGAHI
ncbi:regulatory protein, luxR family [Nonomuraea jiangxiensis]|uniref:Regulatory protein, luxR family n=1 Tax=Nonomuraea jiangxiensis TaxID=633440 RepID=A0A1G9HIJ0_9ACTN|nr:regulatory protein, luxR family [Nonomuraea jiangxiensis]